MILTAIAIYR